MLALSFILTDRALNVHVRVQGITLKPIGTVGPTRYKVISGIFQLVEEETIQTQLDLGPDTKTLVLIDESCDRPVATEIPREKLKLFWAFICRVLKPVRTASREPRGLNLIIPDEAGYIVRSDIFEERLRGCPQIQAVEGFVAPGQYVRPPGSAGNSGSPASLLQSVISCVLVAGSDEKSITQSLDIVQPLLNDRLSLPWLSATQIAARRLAVVGEIRSYNMCARYFQAARALNVIVVAIGNGGHWLEEDTPQNMQLREAYIQLDMTADLEFPSRVATAIRNYQYQIDGITTVTDFLLVPVAEAARLLKLPTLSPEAFGKSVNKYATRLATSPDSCLLVSSHDDLSKLSKSGTSLPPGPPWIVKPSNGWGSTGIIKVSNKEALVAALEKVSSNTGYSGAGLPDSHEPWETKVLVEEYCDGPEVDCNFVLWHGDILFFEVVDNFPCTGDNIDNGTGNFCETQLVFPSALPPSEQLVLRDYLYKSILRLGFRSGVFHAEARVRQSSREYRNGDGSMDLRLKSTAASQEPGAFLIEINARPPGYLDSFASAFVHGVDLNALHILIALEDDIRVQALSKTYRENGHLVVAAIEAERSGIVVSDDPWQDLEQKNPELMSNVVQNVMTFQKGDRVDDPHLDTTLWLSGFTVYSPEGRAQALKMCAQVIAEFHCEIA
ncbi:hypothetical protein MaudCBS49596_000822 [Microsporum audouinii]